MASGAARFSVCVGGVLHAMSQLVARIMTLFAAALELPGDFFDSRIDRHTSALRLLNYPSRARTT